MTPAAPGPWSRTERAVVAILLAALVVALAGCGDVVRPPTAEEVGDLKAKVVQTMIERDQVRDSLTKEHQLAIDEHAIADDFQVKADAARKRADAADAAAAKADREAALAPLRTSLRWLEGLCLLVMIAGVALAIAARFLSLGFAATIPAAAAGGAAGALALCLATSWALDHLLWLGLGVGALAALLGVGYWLHHRTACMVMADALKTGEDALTRLQGLGYTAEALAVKGRAIARQEAAGIQNHLNAARTRLGLRLPVPAPKDPDHG